MSFVEWWFVKHYIASTFLTPEITFAWSIYAGSSNFRILASVFLTMLGNFKGSK